MSKPGWPRRAVVLMLVALLLAGCAAPTPGPVPSPTAIPTPVPTAAPTPTVRPSTPIIPPQSATATAQPASCQLAPVAAPALPAVIPGYAELDDATGLHYTGIYQQIDPAAYSLRVTGKVDRPLALTLDDLRCLPKVKATARIICLGVFEDTAAWAGTPLAAVLALAGVQPGAAEISMLGADDYLVYLPLSTALGPDNFLAYEWEGKPVPILHGFPVRAVFPTLQGSKWVKWLIEIEVQ